MREFAYHFFVTAPNGGESRDTTELMQSITWTGDIRQTARELSAALVIPRDGSVEIPPLEEGAWLTFEVEEQTRFFGPLIQCTTSSQSFVVNVAALDRGRYLAGNQGFYKFVDVTPEAAASSVWVTSRDLRMRFMSDTGGNDPFISEDTGYSYINILLRIISTTLFINNEIMRP